MGDDLAALVRCRYIIGSLVTTQLKLRYHRSALGVLWTLLNPLLLLTVQAAAFSQILRVDVKTYALYLFSGLVVWQFFSTGIDISSRSLISSEGVIRVMPVPKFVFPLSEVLVAMLHAGFGLAAFFVMAFVFGASFHAQLVLLPAAVILLTIFIFGLSLLAMTLMTMFRDVQHIIGVALSAYYFACPILYPPTVTHRFQEVLRYNPMTYYLELFRDALVSASVLAQNATLGGGVWPPASTWLIAAGCSLASLLVGYAVYKTFEHDYIFHL